MEVLLQQKRYQEAKQLLEEKQELDLYLLSNEEHKVNLIWQIYSHTTTTTEWEMILKRFCRFHFVNENDFPKSLQLLLDTWICDYFDVFMSSTLIQYIVTLLQTEYPTQKKNLEMLEYIPKCLQVLEESNQELKWKNQKCTLLEYKKKLIEELCNCEWKPNHLVQCLNCFKHWMVDNGMNLILTKLFQSIPDDYPVEDHSLIMYNILLFPTTTSSSNSYYYTILIHYYQNKSSDFILTMLLMDAIILIIKRSVEFVEEFRKYIEKSHKTHHHSIFVMVLLLICSTIPNQKKKCFPLLSPDSMMMLSFSIQKEELYLPILSIVTEYGFYLMNTTTTYVKQGKNIITFMYSFYSIKSFIIDTIFNQIIENQMNCFEYIDLLSLISDKVDVNQLNKFKELIEYLSFYQTKTAIKLLKALQPIYSLSNEFMDYTILILRKLSFSREEETKIIAFKGFYYAIMANTKVNSSSVINTDLDFEMIQLFKKILSCHHNELKKQCYKNLYQIFVKKSHTQTYIWNYLKQKLESIKMDELENGKEPFAHLIQFVCKLIKEEEEEEEEIMEEEEQVDDEHYLYQYIHFKVMKQTVKQYKNTLTVLTNEESNEQTKHYLFIMHGVVQVMIEYFVLHGVKMEVIEEYFELYCKGEEVLCKKFKDKTQLKKNHIPEFSLEFFLKALELLQDEKMDTPFVQFLLESFKLKKLKKKHIKLLKQMSIVVVKLGKHRAELFKTEKKNLFEKMFQVMVEETLKLIEDENEKIQFVISLIGLEDKESTLEKQFDAMMKHICDKGPTDMVNAEISNLIQYFHIKDEDTLIKNVMFAVEDFTEHFDEKCIKIYYSLYLNLLLKNVKYYDDKLLELVNEIVSQNSIRAVCDVLVAKVKLDLEPVLGIVLVECILDYFQSKQIQNQLSQLIESETYEPMQSIFEHLTHLLKTITNVFTMIVFVSKKGVVEYKLFKIWNFILTILHYIAKQCAPKIQQEAFKSLKLLIETVYDQVNEPMYKKCAQLLSSQSEEIREKLSIHQIKLIGKCYSENVKLLENIETQFVKLSKKYKYNFMNQIKQVQPNFQFKLVLTKKEQSEDEEED